MALYGGYEQVTVVDFFASHTVFMHREFAAVLRQRGAK
jgi:hypothetical protein